MLPIFKILGTSVCRFHCATSNIYMVQGVVAHVVRIWILTKKKPNYFIKGNFWHLLTLHRTSPLQTHIQQQEGRVTWITSSWYLLFSRQPRCWPHALAALHLWVVTEICTTLLVDSGASVSAPPYLHLFRIPSHGLEFLRPGRSEI